MVAKKSAPRSVKKATPRATPAPPPKTSFQKRVEAERARQAKLEAASKRRPASKTAKKAAPMTYYQSRAEAPKRPIPSSSVPKQTAAGMKAWSRDYANWNGSGQGRKPSPSDPKYNF